MFSCYMNRQFSHNTQRRAFSKYVTEQVILKCLIYHMCCLHCIYVEEVLLTFKLFLLFSVAYFSWGVRLHPNMFKVIAKTYVVELLLVIDPLIQFLGTYCLFASRHMRSLSTPCNWRDLPLAQLSGVMVSDFKQMQNIHLHPESHAI